MTNIEKVKPLLNRYQKINFAKSSKKEIWDLGFLTMKALIEWHENTIDSLKMKPKDPVAKFIKAVQESQMKTVKSIGQKRLTKS